MREKRRSVFLFLLVVFFGIGAAVFGFSFFSRLRVQRSSCEQLELTIDIPDDFAFNVSVDNNAFQEICRKTALSELTRSPASILNQEGTIKKVEIKPVSQPQKYFLMVGDDGLVYQSFDYTYDAAQQTLVVFLHIPSLFRSSNERETQISRAELALNHGVSRGLYYFSATAFLFNDAEFSQERVTEKQERQESEYRQVVELVNRQKKRVFTLQDKYAQ